MTSEATTTMVGPYRVDGLIGRGGMGEVYRAYDTRRQRTVALKLLPAALSDDDEYRERFRRESLVAASLTSPHVVPIHDFGDIEGRLFIDMRLIDGSDLAARIAGTPMAPQQAVAITIQVCDALADAHAQGIVHRDVKPSNILLTGTDFAYLVDFGIAAGDGAGPSLTATGNTIGTFGYMAPERFDGRPADPRADIYSLGCVLHELLTGARPFAEHTSTPSLIRAHLMVEPSPPGACGVSTPPALDQVVLAAMCKEPEKRFPNVADLRDALREAVAVPGPRQKPTCELTSFAAAPRSAPATSHTRETIAPSPPQRQVQPDARRRRRLTRGALVCGAVALLGAGVGAGLLLAGNAPATTPGTTAPITSYSPALPGSSLSATTAAFGETQEIRAGVMATAGEPQPYTPSVSAAGEEGASRVMRVEITLTNNTGRFVNFGEQISMNLKIDGARTTSIIDSLDNYKHSVGSVEGKVVPPGGKAVFSAAWALPPTATPVSLELSPMSSGAGGRAVSWSGDA